MKLEEVWSYTTLKPALEIQFSKLLVFFISKYITEKCLNIIYGILGDIQLYTHAHTYIFLVHPWAQKMAGYETSHLLQKKKHDQCMVNSQLYQLKITIMYILNNIIIVNKIDNRLNMQ
jgi:hypothetical protein